MFIKARLKLTLWYVTIMLLISGLFSVAFFKVSTQEIQRIAERIERSHQDWNGQSQQPRFPKPGTPTIEELQASSRRLLTSLILINGIILIFFGGVAYFLAGKTLNPIKLMVKEQNQFISNSSHELRTPLATLRAEMEGSLLERHISDKQARFLINSNLEEVSRLQTLSNNLLKLTKLHGQNKIYSLDHISTKLLITSAIKQVSKLAKNKQIDIIQITVDSTIIGDKESLQELLVIMLENAIKYSKSNTKIKVNAKHVDNCIIIQIKDQGIGIHKKDIPHIFDRFYRSDKSRSQSEGFGLGLSIAKQIVKKHRGDIHVESMIGKGSTFTIKIPAAKS